MSCTAVPGTAAHGLACARECKTDAQCHGYSLERDKGPVTSAGVVCLTYDKTVSCELEQNNRYVTYIK